MLSPTIRRFSVPCRTLLAALACALALPQHHARADDAFLDRAINRLMALDLSPGMGVAIVRNGHPPYLRGLGVVDVESSDPVTPDTIYYIASSTKSFTGLAFAILAERGEISLDATLADYLPNARYSVEVDPSTITMRRLLTHTHGLKGNGPVSFRLAFSGQHSPELLQELLRFHGPSGAGDAFSYTNLGYNVATMALQEARGQFWKDVLDREIFKPLGMTSTSAYRSHLDESRIAPPHDEEPEGFRKLPHNKVDDNMQSAGGMMTTARDMAKWLEVNLDGGRLGGKQVIPEAAIAEAHRKQVSCDTSFGPFLRKGYGLGWYIGPYEGKTMLHHFGGFAGFHAHVSFIPEANAGVVVLTNTASLGGRLAVAVAETAYDDLLAVPDREARFAERLKDVAGTAKQGRNRIAQNRRERAARPQTPAHPLQTYEGTYSSRLMGEVTFKVVNGKLEAKMGPLWSEVEVFDAEADEFRVELAGGGEVVTFKIPEDARHATSFRWQGNVFKWLDDDAS